jgi:hypothetical protein
LFTHQLNTDFGYYWNLKPRVRLTLSSSPSPSLEPWSAYVYDDLSHAKNNLFLAAPPVPGAVGWHDINVNQPYMVILAGTSMSSFRAFNSWTWTFSHELMEMVANPALKYVGPYHAGPAQLIAVGAEVCDPVEGSGYKSHGTILSNFVTPSWFDPQGQPDWDFLETLPGPLMNGPGGTTDVKRLF